MAVCLKKEDIDEWISNKISFKDVLNKFVMNDDCYGELVIYRCSPLVSRVKEKGLKNILSWEDYEKGLDKNGIKRFFGVKNNEKKVEKERKPVD